MNSESKEIFDNIIHDFRNYIGKLTWHGEFWGKRGALNLEKMVSVLYKTLDEEPFELLSATSSTYYAASGNAIANAKNSILFAKVFWYWRAWRYLRKAKKCSDKFASWRGDMSLGELDVRACILNKVRQRNQAAELLSRGINMISTKNAGTKHDLCLFLIHEAEVLVDIRRDKAGYNGDEKAMENYKQAMKLMEDEIVPVGTKVRVMKSYGKFMEIHGETQKAIDILLKALDLARLNNLNDQVVKITPLLSVLILK